MSTERPPSRLTSLELRRFRAFDRFSISFGTPAVLIGPNNAGKSTIVSALRAIAQMLRIAKRLRATMRIDVGESMVWAHPFTTAQVGLEEDSLRWESQSDEVTLRASFSDGSRLKAIWPSDDRGTPFFYVQVSGKQSIREAAEVRRSFPTVGVVPTLSPVERREELRDPKYVRDNVAGRLSSRHFRNQLLLSRRGDLPGVDWAGWSKFLSTWLREMNLGDPELTDSGLDVYYRDDRSPSWKEIVWAGDGFQVFLQSLFHLYRLRDVDVLVLDEPDVYLHADLQLRLMQAAQSLEPQIIVATHSAEIAAEVGATAIVWMDRSRVRAVRAPDDEILGQVAGALGSHFNLRLARVLRARLSLFVEGNDMRLLKRVAHSIGAAAFASELNLALVPIEGSSNWRRVEGFAWLNDNLLGGSVEGLVLLDRDYHADAYVELLISRFREAGLACHVWSRKELESYFLEPSAIARAAGASVESVSAMIADITDLMYEGVLFNYVATVKQDDPEKRRLADGTIAKEFAPWLREVWKDPLQRLWRCPAKDVLSSLNAELRERGYRPVTLERFVRTLRPNEVPEEMARLIRSVNRRLISQS